MIHAYDSRTKMRTMIPIDTVPLSIIFNYCSFMMPKKCNQFWIGISDSCKRLQKTKKTTRERPSKYRILNFKFLNESLLLSIQLNFNYFAHLVVLLQIHDVAQRGDTSGESMLVQYHFKKRFFGSKLYLFSIFVVDQVVHHSIHNL